MLNIVRWETRKMKNDVTSQCRGPKYLLCRDRHLFGCIYAGGEAGLSLFFEV